MRRVTTGLSLPLVAALLGSGGACGPEASGPRPTTGPGVSRRRAPPPRPPAQPRFRSARRHVLTPAQPVSGSVAFSPDGKRLALGGSYGRLMLVRLTDGRPLRTLKADDELDRGLRVRFSRSGEHVLAAGYDACELRVWRARTGRLLRSIPVGRAVHDLVLGRGTRAAVATQGAAVVVDYHSGRTLHRVPMPYGLAARLVAFDGSGTRLAVASAAGHLRLVDVVGRETLAQGRVDASRLTAMALSPDGKQLAVGRADGRVVLRRGADLSRLRQFHFSAPGQAVVGLRYSARGGRLLALTADATLHELDAASGRALARTRLPGSAVRNLAVSRDGRLAAAPRVDGRVALFRSVAHAGRVDLPRTAAPWPAPPRPTFALAVPTQHRLTVAGGEVVSLALSRRGTRVVLGLHPPALSAWALRVGPRPALKRLWRRKVPTRRGRPGRRVRLALSQDDRSAYLHGPADQLRRYALAGGWPVALRPGRHPRATGLRSLLPTPDGRRWITTTDTRRVHVWSNTGARLRSFDALPGPYWVGVSPDSRSFVQVAGVDDLAVYTLATGKQRWHKAGHRHRLLEVMALRFSPDSKRLYTYHRTGFLRTYDPATGRRVGHRRIATPPGLSACDLRPDVKVLVCAVGRALRFYEVSTGALLRVVRSRTRGQVLGLGYSRDGSTVIVLDSAHQVRLIRFP